MLPLAILALQAPAQFVVAVDKYAAVSNTLRVADWWEDDLDNDGKNESIALLCDDRRGVYLVQTAAGALLEAPVEIDGRNSCHGLVVGKPAWHSEHDGAIVERVAVHHGEDSYAFAIRNQALVVVRQRSTGFDVTRDGRTTETDLYDYDHLTWSHQEDSDGGPSTVTRGAWLIAAGDGRRTTTLPGATLIAAADGQRYTVHVHADRPVSVGTCADQSPSCAVASNARGDFDVTIPGDRCFVTIDGTTVEVRLQTTDNGYPLPPTPY